MNFLWPIMTLSLICGSVQADVIELPEGEITPEIMLPAKGMSMDDVAKKYGEPREKFGAVGGAPRQPPITRWDYDAFAVIFERDRVIDAVIPGAPPPIHNKEELQETPAAAQAISETTPPATP